MVRVKAFGIKLIVHLIVVLSIFGIFYQASNLMNLVWVSLIVAGLSFAIGDLFLLPRIGNTLSTFADFGLTLVSLWFLTNFFIDAPMSLLLASFYGAFFIAFTEPFLHAYIQEKSIEATNTRRPIPRMLQTEFSKETDAQSIKSSKNRKED